MLLLEQGIDLNKLKILEKKENLSNVTFLPPVKMEEIGDYLKYADLLLVHLKNDPLFEITIPSKIQATWLWKAFISWGKGQCIRNC